MKDVDFEGFWSATSEPQRVDSDIAQALWRAMAQIVRDERHGAIAAVGSSMDGRRDLLQRMMLAHGLGDRFLNTFEPAAHGQNQQKSGRRRLLGKRLLSMGGRKNSESPEPPIEVQMEATGPLSLIWLANTPAEMTGTALRLLIPNFVPGGVLIVSGRECIAAANQWFDEGPATAKKRRPFLIPVGQDLCLAANPANEWGADRGLYDYTPPGFVDPGLLPLFPSLVVTDPTPIGWPWFRKKGPHIWRTDTRAEKRLIGVLSYEEAMVLHNVALPFRGKRAVEIGCHLAWSTAHLVAAGLELDVIDPALGGHRHHKAVVDSVSAVREALTDAGTARFYAGYSPSIVPPVASTRSEPWSLAFIDGWHEDDAPADDAASVLPHMADDAIAIFHDLNAPAVARGLDVFADAGWSVRFYNTTQVMAVAWRGRVDLPDYSADPNMPQPHYGHLSGRDFG